MIGTVLCMPSCGTQPAAEAPQELLRALLFKEPLKAAQVTERRIGGPGLPPGSTRRHSARLLDAAQGSRTFKKAMPSAGNWGMGCRSGFALWHQVKLSGRSQGLANLPKTQSPPPE